MFPEAGAVNRVICHGKSVKHNRKEKNWKMYVGSSIRKPQLTQERTMSDVEI